MKTTAIDQKTYASTRNACKLCSPLGASVAYKGVESCIPLIHGGQGCATYIRRYLISHYREPVDIASTNFSEESAIFGGGKNFEIGLDNIISQYKPEMVGICTTCLSETIGDDIKLMLKQYTTKRQGEDLPVFVHAATPSYKGSHADGFHETVLAMVKTIAKNGSRKGYINLFPGMVSPEDLRHLKEIFTDFGEDLILLPDFSETLDNPTWDEYHKLPPGGTPVSRIQKMGCAVASIEFGSVFSAGKLSDADDHKAVETPGIFLEKNFLVKNHQTTLPIGIHQTDKFFEIMKSLSGKPTPKKYMDERGRLIDAYADGHKHVFGKRAVVYGEEDLVISMIGFLLEIGVIPVLCASGGKSGKIKQYVDTLPESDKIIVKDDADFEEIKEMAPELKPDFFIGHSKGYYITRELNIPLIRVGFPIHDRIGGQRILHLGYRGAQQLFDKIANAIIEYKQENSPVAYKYM